MLDALSEQQLAELEQKLGEKRLQHEEAEKKTLPPPAPRLGKFTGEQPVPKQSQSASSSAGSALVSGILPMSSADSGGGDGGGDSGRW